jgi:hypothetical protein
MVLYYNGHSFTISYISEGQLRQATVTNHLIHSWRLQLLTIDERMNFTTESECFVNYIFSGSEVGAEPVSIRLHSSGRIS